MLAQPPPQAMSATRAPGADSRSCTSGIAGSHSWAKQPQEQRPVDVGLRLAPVGAVRLPRDAAAGPVGVQEIRIRPATSAAVRAIGAT